MKIKRPTLKPKPQLTERYPLFLLLVKRAGLPEPHREYQFCLSRKWRADYAWPHAKLIVEVQGGVWTRGRHGRGSGIVKDMEKFNAAAALGWRVMQCTPKDTGDLSFIALLARALHAEDAA